MAWSARKLSLGVLLCTLAAYLLTANGHLQGPDHGYYFRMAESLAREASFAVDPTGLAPSISGRGVDERIYTVYAPGLPLALAPLVVVGRASEGLVAELRPHYRWGHRGTREMAALFVVSYFNGPVTAATAALLTLLVLRLGYPKRPAVFTGLAFALASPAWGQARSLFAEPLLGLCLVLTALLLVRRTGPRSAALAGCALGAAILVKLTGFVAVPAFLLWLWWPNLRPRLSRETVAFLLPVAVAALCHALYNYGRFDSPLLFGYGGATPTNMMREPWSGLVGLLLSPGRGVFFYAPILLVAIWAYRPFRQQHPALGWFLPALLLPWLLVHANYRDWDSGWGWGPRYLLPVMPLALLPLAQAWRDRRLRHAAVGLFAIGVAIQVPGATVDFMDAGRLVSARLREYRAECRGCPAPTLRDWYFFDPRNSDILVHAQLLKDGKLDLAWVHFRGTWVTPLTLSLSLTCALVGASLLWRTALPRRATTRRSGRLLEGTVAVEAQQHRGQVRPGDHPRQAWVEQKDGAG